MHPFEKYIVGKIAKLGDKPGKIAKSLKRLGYRGELDSIDSNPLAIYLSDMCPYGAHIDVYKDNTEIDQLEIIHSKAVSRFLVMFNREQYPDLIV